MNEQRIAQYVQLIQELLACPNGQEPRSRSIRNIGQDPKFLRMLEKHKVRCLM